MQIKKVNILQHVKSDNKLYFEKGNDNFFGVVKRDFWERSDGRLFMREHHVKEDIKLDCWKVREITIEDGCYEIGTPMEVYSHDAANGRGVPNFIKNQIL